MLLTTGAAVHEPSLDDGPALGGRDRFTVDAVAFGDDVALAPTATPVPADAVTGPAVASVTEASAALTATPVPADAVTGSEVLSVGAVGGADGLVRTVWDDLADCESGNWLDGGRDFETGSARWDWGAAAFDHPPWSSELFDGGLQFHPDTWRWVAGDLGLLGAYPYAYTAPRHVQIEVAELTQQRQGWGAWPVCSVKVGLRG